MTTCNNAYADPQYQAYQGYPQYSENQGGVYPGYADLSNQGNNQPAAQPGYYQLNVLPASTLNQQEIQDQLEDTLNTLDVYQGNPQVRFPQRIQVLQPGFFDKVIKFCSENGLELLFIFGHVVANRNGGGTQIQTGAFSNNSISVNDNNSENNSGKILLAGAAAGGGMFALGAFYRKYTNLTQQLSVACSFKSRLAANWGSYTHQSDTYDKIVRINDLYIKSLENIISNHRFVVAVVAGIAFGGSVALFGYIFAAKTAVTFGAALGAGASLAGLFKLGYGDDSAQHTSKNIGTINRLYEEIKDTLAFLSHPQQSYYTVPAAFASPQPQYHQQQYPQHAYGQPYYSQQYQHQQ
ncbi:MAG: hypothetical protein WC222_09575 [Parachlamydiales bacterium]|jgi:hypothetical protein